MYLCVGKTDYCVYAFVCMSVCCMCTRFDVARTQKREELNKVRIVVREENTSNARSSASTEENSVCVRTELDSMFARREQQTVPPPFTYSFSMCVGMSLLCVHFGVRVAYV